MIFPDHTENIVEIKDLSFSYNESIVLRNINLEIHKGDYIGMIGPNGGGKTTLIKLILGLLKPDKGTITLNTKNIAYVGQKATSIDQKFPITAYEVVSLGRYANSGIFKKLNKTDKTVIEDAMDQVGITNLKDKLIGNLSGGQQQRVFIARALAQKPEIIFLDEPTSGVDQDSQEQFYKILKRLNQELGITLILISHDIDVITKEVTEVAAVSQKIIYYGSAKKFVKDEHLEKMYSKGVAFFDHKH